MLYHRIITMVLLKYRISGLTNTSKLHDNGCLGTFKKFGDGYT